MAAASPGHFYTSNPSKLRPSPPPPYLIQEQTPVSLNNTLWHFEGKEHKAAEATDDNVSLVERGNVSRDDRFLTQQPGAVFSPENRNPKDRWNTRTLQQFKIAHLPSCCYSNTASPGLRLHHFASLLNTRMPISFFLPA